MASTERIDYDLVWSAKRAALELLWRAEDGHPATTTPHRPDSLIGRRTARG